MSPDLSQPVASSLDDIVKAYDIRGTYPDEINARIAYAVGVGFGTFVLAQDAADKRVVVARDIRQSGVELSHALSAGIVSVGLGVVDIGLASTDLLYFASGKLDLAGAMLTASHNPPNYNGIKLCLARRAPDRPRLGSLRGAPCCQPSPRRRAPRTGASPPSRTTGASSTATCSRSSPPTCARSSTSRA